jgi:toxin ParE1/3/4
MAAAFYARGRSSGDPRSATRFVEGILRRCELLAGQPGIGRLRADLAPNLRSFAVGRYLILYRPLDGGIEVARVLHGARNLKAQFPDRSARSPRGVRFPPQYIGGTAILLGVQRLSRDNVIFDPVANVNLGESEGPRKSTGS